MKPAWNLGYLVSEHVGKHPALSTRPTHKYPTEIAIQVQKERGRKQSTRVPAPLNHLAGSLSSLLTTCPDRSQSLELFERSSVPEKRLNPLNPCFPCFSRDGRVQDDSDRFHENEAQANSAIEKDFRDILSWSGMAPTFLIGCYVLEARIWTKSQTFMWLMASIIQAKSSE